jgi:hypothetical protein
VDAGRDGGQAVMKVLPCGEPSTRGAPVGRTAPSTPFRGRTVPSSWAGGRRSVHSTPLRGPTDHPSPSQGTKGQLAPPCGESGGGRREPTSFRPLRVRRNRTIPGPRLREHSLRVAEDQGPGDVGSGRPGMTSTRVTRSPHASAVAVHTLADGRICDAYVRLRPDSGASVSGG